MIISVIMPVNLGHYKCDVTHNPDHSEDRFKQAVLSFTHQSLSGNELIIISDGCDVAEAIYKEWFLYHPLIRFKKIPKQEDYSGEVRNTGLAMARGEIISYLDHDDVIGFNHIKIISDNFDTNQYDWVYYNDYLVDTVIAQKEERNVDPVFCSIGTSAITHRRDVDVKWGTGYGHDWWMIEKYLLPLRYTKIPTPEYYVCHFRKIDDF
jgi:glycosyltransferase involved in cell wall biosynthesis